jgi:hypothetical protein
MEILHLRIGRSFSTIPNLVPGHATGLILAIQMLVAP